MFPTNPYELIRLFGCLFVMCYNRVSKQADYWSQHSSLGNECIKKVFLRDRSKLLASKLYMNEPDKEQSQNKLHYVEELFSCFKYTFQKFREDSPFQSIDESMTKFKGHCSFRQYLPTKPVKHGVKVWMPGYTYDGITSFRCDHFGATYFIAVRFLHKLFRRQFGAL